MHLRLTYRGPLRSAQKANLPHIHEIRRKLHTQMKKCWEFPPLSDQRSLIAQPPEPSLTNVIETRRGFVFAPLVTSKLHLTAEISIFFLRPANLLLAAGQSRRPLPRRRPRQQD
jgi:hypothetical protein